MDKTTVFLLYPSFHMVYGPYTRPDGRQHVILIGRDIQGNEIRRTVSYPKLLAEINLGRRLLDNETVDHQDRDFNNNDFSNFVIRPKAEHSSLDALRVRVGDVNCPICGESFTPTRNQLGERVSHKPGPFCSKKCASSYKFKVKNDFPQIERTHVEVTYYRLDKI